MGMKDAIVEVTQSAKTLVGGKNAKSELQREWEDACSLSYSQRIWGFGICFTLGCLLTILGSLSAPSIALGSPEKFAIPYSMGSLCSLASTFFLMGPFRQCKFMCAKTRWKISLIYFSSIF